jgi:UDP-3-O-[3-hydroxymyristoyl] glucosamine N-acyltransferase
MSTSVVAPSAKIDPGAKLGEFCVVGEDVHVAAGCIIGHNVVIHDGTVIGANVRIDDGTVIGKRPMRAANSAVTQDEELEPCRIADGCIIGTNVVIYRGATIDESVMIADLSTVREHVRIGRKTIVGRGVAIENKCTIGKYCKLETNVYVTALSEVGDRAFLAPGVITTNDNFVGRTEERKKHFKGVVVEKAGRIGANATILPGKTIGEDSLVAAGALVTKDVPGGKIVFGAPAKVLKDVPKEQLLENQNWEDN